MIKKLGILMVLLAGSLAGHAQYNVAIKTNLLMDAALNVNAGVEVGLAPHWSLDLSGQYNGWAVNDHRWKNWVVQPEARYWFCDRFAKSFLALHALGGGFNWGNLDMPYSFLGSNFRNLKDHRYQGWGAGAGIGYGYDWVINKHWNIEAEIGVGWIYLKYDEFECQDCGKKIGNGHHNYFGPTKVAINLEYLF